MNDQMKMPRAVAVELLTEPKAQLSARLRKNCFAALDKPVEVDGAAGYSSGRSPLARRSMAQLCKWWRRAERQAYKAFCAISVFSPDPSQAKRVELLKMLRENWLRVQEVLSIEIKSRIKNV